jgi:hypothetical protein
MMKKYPQMVVVVVVGVMNYFCIESRKTSLVADRDK